MPPTLTPSAILSEFARSTAYAATAKTKNRPTAAARAICALRPTNQKEFRHPPGGFPGVCRRASAVAPAPGDVLGRSDPQGLAIRGYAPALAGVLAANVRAPAKELLHLALVGVGVLRPPHHGREPLMLRQLQHGLAGRVAVAKAGRLVEAVVDPPPE